MYQDTSRQRAPTVLAASFDASKVPALVIDSDACVVWFNRATIGGAGLSPTALQDGGSGESGHPTLAAIRRARDGAATTGAYGYALVDGTGQDDDVLVIAILEVGAGAHGRDLTLVLLMSRARADPGTRFGLTRVEQALVAEIRNGRTVREAADALRISSPTARKYLQIVFQKTGTNRQAQLVSLLNESSVERDRLAFSRLP